MKKLTKIIFYLIILLLFFTPFTNTTAQSYNFEVTQYDVQAVIEEDGTLTLFYEMHFKNGIGAHPIDFVDLGLPNSSYSLENIKATIDDKPVSKISQSSYVQGAELALGENQIPANATGVVKATVTGITNVIYPYDGNDRENYVNFQFIPNYFDSTIDRSRNTKYNFSIVLPPAVGADEGVYFKPKGWHGNNDPLAELTPDQNRVIYIWATDNANTHTAYTFGVAFPAAAIPSHAIVSKGVAAPPSGKSTGSGSTGVSGIFSWLFNRLGNFACFIPIIMFVISLGFAQKKQHEVSDARKLAYMPPTLSVEGHGIKRGLTAVEAAILLQEPVDKVLTMILFGLLKKEAITVIKQEPLEIKPSDPLPSGLYAYEIGFIEALKPYGTTTKKKGLQDTLVGLVKSVERKMKGFNGTKTKEYYQDIINRAWQAVEAADTPELKSAQFDHTLEWTMLDKDFSGRTTRTFTDTPVFLPRWWVRYNPIYSQMPSTGGGLASSGGMASGGGVQASPAPSMAGPSPKPSFSLPNLPGSAFAASVVDGGANMAKSVIGNTTDFTSAVTSRTNPPPVVTTSSSSGRSSGRHSGGGGSSCACACACAGCACACAGGGR
jgi:hypothetical protein